MPVSSISDVDLGVSRTSRFGTCCDTQADQRSDFALERTDLEYASAQYGGGPVEVVVLLAAGHDLSTGDFEGVFRPGLDRGLRCRIGRATAWRALGSLGSTDQSKRHSALRLQSWTVSAIALIESILRWRIVARPLPTRSFGNVGRA